MLPDSTPALSDGCVDFIDDAAIQDRLKEGRPDPVRIAEILTKARGMEPLDLDETAALLRIDDDALWAEVLDTARDLKRKVYGDRIVLFAPLYVGNECRNECAYCAFRRSNRMAIRCTLDDKALTEQTERLVDAGHKRLVLVWGEHEDYGPEAIAEAVATVYGVRRPRGQIRRVNINAAPMDDEGYRRIRVAGIGTYQVFQETYHHGTYRKMHPPRTTKGDYLWRLDAQARAIEAGLDDVGIGALFGLHDWRFEVLGLVAHARNLRDRYGVGPHTISVPRLRPASGVLVEHRRQVRDEEMERIVAVLRLAAPYAGLIITAREPAALRRRLLDLGVSQVDGGSRIELGGYGRTGQQELRREQFSLGDERSLEEVVADLLDGGHVPSFCTACYRRGRTGEAFMDLAEPGRIHQFCTANALTSLTEYLVDFASEETRRRGLERVGSALAQMPSGKSRARIADAIARIQSGEDRDVQI